jgi:phosphatidylglycerol lysyltransferase
MPARRLQQVLPVVFGLVLFTAMLEVLRFELRTTSWHEITTDIAATPLPRLVAAAILTIANYVVLIGYDLLAFRFIANALAPRRIALAAALAYAVSHSVGFATLSGASVRYRFYARWGVGAEELSRVMLFYSVTLWMGILTLGGLSAVLSPLPAALPISHTAVRAIGWMLLASVAWYLGATFFRKAPLRTRLITVTLPPPTMALRQLALSVLDWGLAGSVLYVLLPSGAPPLLTFLGLYLAAILVGVVSHVPGGLGVFEGLMVLFLKPWLDAGDLLSAFVAYRTIYYLLPLGAALLYLVGDEVHERRVQVARAATWLGAATEALAPRVMAAITFLSGALLLFSGATPAAGARLDLLHRVFPPA